MAATSVIYKRMFMYALTVVMHVSNIAHMATAHTKNAEESDDPFEKVFSSLQARFFTCWTFFLQVLYAIVGLVCDGLILKNASNKKYKLPKYLRGFRDTLFSSVLWPSSWVVFTVFWFLYNYDRRLIYPPFVDKVLTSTSNHIMHTFIVPVVLWELYFQPRYSPRSHKRNLFHLTFHFALYLSVIIYTYVETGIWLYPIFKVVYGTIYFPVVHLTIFSAALAFYFVQWPLTRILWSQEKKQKIK